MKKRKLFSIMVLIGFLVGVSGTLTSCKDYDDDAEWKEQTAQNKTLTQALQEQLAQLQSAQTTCKSQCDANNQAISALQTALGSLQTELGSMQTTLTNLSTQVGTNTTNITNLTTRIGTVENSITTINNSITSLQQANKELASADSALNARIDSSNTVLSAAIEANKTAIDEATGRITANETAIATLQGQLADAINANNTAISEINGRIDGIETRVGTVESNLSSLTSEVGTLTSTVSTLSESLSTLSTTVSGLQTTLSTLESTVSTLSSTVSTIESNLSTLTSTVTTMKTELEQKLEQAQTATNERFTEVYQKIYSDSTTLAQAAAEAKSVADSANSLAKLAIDSITKVAGQVATVKELAEQNEAAISALDSRVSALETLVGQIQNALNLQVTNILVNGTLNPIFGYYAVPSGDIRSTVLATYYGNPGQFNFLSTNEADYANTKDPTLTLADLRVTGQQTITLNSEDKTIVTKDGAAGNAGDMWLTLNPIGVDLTGKAFSLVNSQGTTSPMTLTAAQASNDLLYFGYTRAASANGLYRVSGTVSPEAASELTPNVDMQQMKDEVKTLYRTWRDRATNGGMQVNFSELISVIYHNINNVLPALALKTTWSDELNGEPRENSVISQYSIAATAVHPFSFGTLANRTWTPLPTYTAMQDIDLDIDTITLNTIDINDINVDVYDNNGNVIGHYTLDQLQDIVRQINGDFAGTQSQVNDMIRSVEDQVSFANNKIDRFNRILTRYNRWANRVNGWFSRNGNNNINRSLQPVIFYASGDDLAKLGNAKYGTAILPSGSSLLATTYTFEMLAPAYKKWVAVTNVWKDNNAAVVDQVSAQKGDADLLTALYKANNGENMNSVVYGTTRAFTLGELQSNYVYEITYAAVDYTGKNVVRRFYISGK